MIYITGDTHSNFSRFQKMKKVPKINKFFQNFEKTLTCNKIFAIIKIQNINII